LIVGNGEIGDRNEFEMTPNKCHGVGLMRSARPIEYVAPTVTMLSRSAAVDHARVATLPGIGADARPTQPSPPLDLVAGRYRLIEPLGTGGTGTVWLARDRILGRLVAVKHLVSPEPRASAQALREARAAARVTHANVVRVYDVVTDDGCGACIVMELLTGRSLSAETSAQGRLSVRAVRRVASGLIGALDALHGAGLVHRDVKPSNIRLCEDGRVVLTDLGSAVPIHFARAGSAQLTGTLGFIAPETISSGTYSTATDMYALGATLYFAAQGRLPFEFGCLEDLIDHAADPAVAPRADRAGWLNLLIEGLLQPDPANRWDGAAARGHIRAHKRVAADRPGADAEVGLALGYSSRIRGTLNR
jgi:serine/threonine protein kinase